MMLTEGTQAPDFSLLNEQGQAVSLSAYRGKTVVIYFYPKDDTPGCTKEACSFRDNIAELQAQNTVVFGISADSPESHQKFIEKFQLPFSLLSDPDHSVIKAWGAWGQKSMYGKTYDGIMRYTYIVGPDGKIKKSIEKVKTDSHGQDVLQYIN